MLSVKWLQPLLYYLCDSFTLSLRLSFNYCLIFLSIN